MVETIVIAAGGTGGHIFPAQELAKKICSVSEQKYNVCFVANGLTKNKHFKSDQFDYVDVESSQFSFNLRTILKACLKIPKGIYQSYRLFKKIQPRLVVGFGSYHTVPVLTAANMLSIPIILHSADSVPGRVNRLFSSKACWTGIFFPQAREYLSGPVQQVDIPLKKEFYNPHKSSRADALSYYGLSESKKTVLIFGGSQGAKAINGLILKMLPILKNIKMIQLIHFTGNDESSLRSNEMLSRLGIPGVVKNFEPYMFFAWAAADLCISRSGASTIAEQIAYAVPAIFIPYPYAQDNHQELNALWMQNTVGAAKVVNEQHATPEILAQILDETIGNSDNYNTMKKQLLTLRDELTPCDFSQLILQFLQEERQ
jgi:UDP-N-acetylglucosamine--N-acetylmuramyl-(pentapeptide) pyrophosphoryl-undecaprenol N-acetylglucosamine transferase